MKKILLLIPMLIMISCNSSPIEQAINAYMFDGYTEEDSEFIYKPIETVLEKEITVAETKEAINAFMQSELKLNDLFETPDKSEFEKTRNREFKVYRYYSPTYEYDVMKGELKDKSTWCTEIRLITEKADSLLNVWDTVDGNNPDYIYLMCWYNNRMNQFSKLGWSENLEIMASNPEYSKQLSEYRKILDNMENNETALLKVKHIFTVTNTFEEKTIKSKDYFYMTPSYKVIYNETDESILLD